MFSPSILLLLSNIDLIPSHNVDLSYKNLVLIRNAISAMVFAGESHEKEEPGVRENRCNPREIFPVIGEIFLENPQGRVGTFPNGTDLNLSRVLANVPNQDGDKREEDARTWPRLLASFCRG